MLALLLSEIAGLIVWPVCLAMPEEKCVERLSYLSSLPLRVFAQASLLTGLPTPQGLMQRNIRSNDVASPLRLEDSSKNSAVPPFLCLPPYSPKICQGLPTAVAPGAGSMPWLLCEARFRVRIATGF